MSKMSDYPSVDNQQAFTPAQKAAFLGSAMCIATGSIDDQNPSTEKVTANIPLTDIAPDLSQYYTKTQADDKFLTENKVGNVIVYDESSGGLCVNYDDGLTMVERKLCVSIPVPAPAQAHADVGKVLTVTQNGNSDEVVWSAPAGGLPAYDGTKAGYILAVNFEGTGLEWIDPSGS